MLTREHNEFVARVGPGTPMGNLLRRFWIPLLLAEELPAPDCPPVRARLLGEDLVAFRDSQGRLGLLDEFCPHRRASLFFGRNEEGGLRCVYHGWKYDAEGRCVDMPNEPAESNFKHKVRLTAYPCQERGGLVWAYLGPRELTPELPELEWALVPDSHRYILKMVTDSNYLQAIEGDIDNSHASFLHGSLGSGEDFPERLAAGGGVRPSLRSQPDRAKFSNLFAKDTAPRGFVRDTDYGTMMGWRRNTGEDSYYWRINHWLAPFYAVLASPPGSTMLCNVRIPADDEHNWFFRIMWNPHRPLTDQELYEYRYGGVVFPEMIPGTFQPKENKKNDYNIDRALQRSFSVSGIKSVPQQDRAVTESMGAIVDRSKEHLGTSDVVIIAMRRKLRKLALDLQAGVEPYAAAHGEAYRVRGADVLLARGVPFDEGAKELLVATA